MLSDKKDAFDLAVRKDQVVSIDAMRSLQKVEQDRIKIHSEFILASGVMPTDIDDNTRHQLAMSAAILQANYDISVVASEAYFIPVDDGGYRVEIGYKGLAKALIRISVYLGKTWIEGKTTYMSPEEVERLGLHVCRRCGGKGEYYHRKKQKVLKCYTCDGAGKFDPAEVLYCEREFVCVEDKAAADMVGVQYYPQRGSSLWLPCDNVARSKTPQWVVEKNALKDFCRRVAPPTMAVDTPLGLSKNANCEDASTQHIANLANEIGVKYDDVYSLADFVRSCLRAKEWNWADEAQVLEAFIGCGIDWEASKESEIKFRIFGWKSGEYPVTSEVLAKDEPASGVLVMNIMLDLGRESAEEACEKLYAVPMSKALTRQQLVDIIRECNGSDSKPDQD